MKENENDIRTELYRIIQYNTKLTKSNYQYFISHINLPFIEVVDVFYWIVLRGDKIELADYIIDNKLFDINKKENYSKLLECAFGQSTFMIDEYVYYGLILNQELLDNVVSDLMEEDFCFDKGENDVFDYLVEQVQINMRGQKIRKIKEKSKKLD